MGADTPYWELAVAMVMVGVGVGSTQQNLVLAVQNQVALRDMGAASSTVAFFRSLGGAAGVAALGALLSSHVSSAITSGLTAAGIPASATSSSGGSIPNLATLPAAIRTVVENAYGSSVALMFLVAAPLALIALVAILFLREVPLRTTIDMDSSADPAEAPTRFEAEPAAEPVGEPVDAGSLLEGTVRDGGRPAPGAVLTVIDRGGHQLARTVADDDGRYRLAVDGDAVPHLLVAQWRGSPHVELLGGTVGPQRRDVAIATAPAGRHRAVTDLTALDAATEVLPAVSR
jgi:hypothetical protein